MIYKTFKEWKNGNYLEDLEPRKEAYTQDELLLIEMGWNYGFDAGVEAGRKDVNTELVEALRSLFNDYKALADSGDAGNWCLEQQPVGEQALAALAKALGENND